MSEQKPEKAQTCLAAGCDPCAPQCQAFHGQERAPETTEFAYRRDHSSMNTRPNGRPIKMHRPDDPERPCFAACSAAILLDHDSPVTVASVAPASLCRRCFPLATPPGATS